MDFGGSSEAVVVYVVGVVVFFGVLLYFLKDWASRDPPGRRQPVVPKRPKQRNDQKNKDHGPPGRRVKDRRNVQIR